MYSADAFNSRLRDDLVPLGSSVTKISNKEMKYAACVDLSPKAERWDHFTVGEVNET